MSQVTIEVSCGKKNSHPVTIEVVGWDRWLAVPPICKRHWFYRWFSFFAPCRRQIEARTLKLKIALVEAIFSTNPEVFLPALSDALSDECSIGQLILSRLQSVANHRLVLTLCNAAYSSPHAEVRSQARQLVHRSPMDLPPRLAEQFIADPRNSSAFRCDLLEVVARGTDSEAAQVLLRCGGSSERAVSDKATELLIAGLSRYTNQILSLLPRVDSSLKTVVLGVVRRSQDSSKLLILERLSEDLNDSVRQDAAEQLAPLATPDRVPIFLRLAKDTVAETRKIACGVLARFPNPKNISVLDSLLQDRDLNVREAACKALTSHGDDAIPCLVRALGNSHVPVCKISIDQLIKVSCTSSSPNPVALRHLVQTAGSTCPARQRYLAAAVLARRGASKWTEILIESLWSDEPELLKDYVEEGLLKIGTPALSTLKEQFIRSSRSGTSDKDARTLARIIRITTEILEKSGNHDEEIIKDLETLSRESPYYSVSSAAKNALETLRKKTRR